jgi:membrane protease YdiL (CAAX protease family)
MRIDRAYGRGTLPAFFVWLLVLSSVFWALAWLTASGAWAIGAPKAREWFVTGIMWCPGLAALIACATTGTSFGALGLRLPRGRWLGIASLYPVVYLVVAYALVWGLGFGTFDGSAFAAESGKRWSLAGTPAFIAGVLTTVSIGVLVEIGRSLGEEIGWRGLLAPAWSARFGLTIGALASALVWGLWHLPLLAAYGFGELPSWYAMLVFVLGLLPIGYVCAWLRWRSHSVWPAVVVHSVHNALLYPLFEMNTQPTGARTAYATGETGFMLLLVNLPLAWCIWRTTRQMRQGALAQIS